MPDTDDLEYVAFLLPDGSEISNDPRWIKKQHFKQVTDQNAAENAANSAVQEQLAQYRARAEAAEAELAAQKASGEIDDEDLGDDPENHFDQMTVKELQAEAAERDIDVAKIPHAGERLKKSELVAALVEHDNNTKA